MTVTPLHKESDRPISRIDEFKGAWRALGALEPDRLAGLRSVATIESVGSSTRIEGNRLSDREVARLLSNLEVTRLATRDEQEVAGYAGVMERVFASWRDIPLTENHVRQLHRDLLIYSDKDARHRGGYKTLPNNVVAFGPDGEQIGVVFETATPFDTPQLMKELVRWVAQERAAGQLHPLLLIGVFVVVFLAIHPFQDGNGRLSRVLTTLLLLQAGYAFVPYSSLEAVIEERKEEYYVGLRATQVTLWGESPDWQPWSTFVLGAIVEQVGRLERKLEREHVVIAALPALSVQVLEFVREHGRVTMADAIRLTGSNRNTLKQHLRALVERGYLHPRGAGRGAWYELGAIGTRARS